MPPKIHLVDRNPELVNCWRTLFADCPEVEIVNGDILQVARDTLVSPANSAGYMDGGIDACYLDYFGIQLQTTVQEAIARCPDHILPVGSAILVRTGHHHIPYLIAAPTMAGPEPVKAINAGLSMFAVLQTAEAHRNEIHDIYCPGLATGVGAASNEMVKMAAREMAFAYRKWKIRAPADRWL